MIESKKKIGSIEFQIENLSIEIKKLTEHLKSFKKDYHSKYGLIKKVSKRKALLKYLKNRNKVNIEETSLEV